MSSRIWKDAEALYRFLSINRDIFIRTLCLTLAFGMFYSFSSASGALVLAVNVILLQFVNWMSYAIDGFAYAAESLVGKYRGRRDLQGTNRAIKYSLLWGLGFALLFSALYGGLGREIFRLFTDQQDVLLAGRSYLFLMILFPIAGFACYIWDGIFIGLTASRAMRNAMLLSFAVYLILLFSFEGKYALWAALILFLFARGVIQYLMFRRYGWELT